MSDLIPHFNSLIWDRWLTQIRLPFREIKWTWFAKSLASVVSSSRIWQTVRFATKNNFRDFWLRHFPSTSSPAGLVLLFQNKWMCHSEQSLHCWTFHTCVAELRASLTSKKQRGLGPFTLSLYFKYLFTSLSPVLNSKQRKRVPAKFHCVVFPVYISTLANVQFS